MKNLILSGFVFTLALLSGCQMIFGTSEDKALSDPDSQNVKEDISNQESDFKTAESQSPEDSDQNAEPPKEETAKDQPIPPSMGKPQNEPNNAEIPVVPDLPVQENIPLKGPQFNNPEELKQYIADNQETTQKNDLPPKNIKCHVHTDSLNSKFFEFTNEYETKFSEKGLKQSYCDEKTIEYYGSSEFDFDCYEVKKDNETKVKNGFEVKHHISCTPPNAQGADDSSDIQIVNPFYDSSSKNKKINEANEEAELKRQIEIAEEQSMKQEAEALQNLQNSIDELNRAKQQAESDNNRSKTEQEEIDTELQRLREAQEKTLLP